MNLLNAVGERVVRYIIEECHRQQSGERSVGWLLNAWLWADEQHKKRVEVSVDFIDRLGRMVEPAVNARGFRHVQVYVGGNKKLDHTLVREQLQNLVEAWNEGRMDDPSLFYFEYEEIHPFSDGNGRSGKVLLNYLSGTLRNPIMPPNFWNCSNP